MVEHRTVNPRTRVRFPIDNPLNMNTSKEDILYKNTKTQDKRRGRTNNLTRSFIKCLIKDGCVYCGNKDTNNMSVDRVRNHEGHMQHNVVSACIECNKTRGAVPFFTWLIAIKITKQGFYGT